MEEINRIYSQNSIEKKGYRFEKKLNTGTRLNFEIKYQNKKMKMDLAGFVFQSKLLRLCMILFVWTFICRNAATYF